MIKNIQSEIQLATILNKIEDKIIFLKNKNINEDNWYKRGCRQDACNKLDSAKDKLKIAFNRRNWDDLEFKNHQQILNNIT